MGKKKVSEEIKVNNVENSYDRIPSEVEIFGRKIRTYDDSHTLNLTRNFGEARYGINQIALSTMMDGNAIAQEEVKITYLHELLHFILNFTSFDPIFREKGIDVEQFVDMVSSALYQYEKSAKY